MEHGQGTQVLPPGLFNQCWSSGEVEEGGVEEGEVLLRVSAS